MDFGQIAVQAEALWNNQASYCSEFIPRRPRGSGRLCVRFHLSVLLLISGQRGSQKPEFGLHFGGIVHGIRDFLAKEFAVPLAKPVYRDFERPLGCVHLPG